MIPKPESCRDCLLYGDGQGFIQPEGTGANNVLIIGENNT